MIKVIHIITGLDVGGAETMLYKLLSQTDRKRFEVQVISLSGIGPIGERILDIGIPVRSLNLKPHCPNPCLLLGLARRLRADKPHVVQTWMHHADLFGGLAARLAGDAAVAWNIRHSYLDPAAVKRTTILIGTLCARLSGRIPSRIVCCSEAGARVHRDMGYPADKMVVIPNGFDLTVFRPDPSARLALREELGLAPDALIVGLVGRSTGLKDHGNFVAAARMLSAEMPDVHYVLCGDGQNWTNARLAGWIYDAGLRERFHLLGRRRDIPRLAAAFDLAASSSYSEGFPNVLGEAMACEVPCVATDAGDSAAIIGNTGIVVPTRDSPRLAAAFSTLLNASPSFRAQLGKAARCRIREHFSLSAITSRYEQLYEELARGCVASPVSLS